MQTRLSKNEMKICSAGSKESLTKLINEFYYSKHWFINDQNKAENAKTGKIVGRIEKKRNRHIYLRHLKE